jgi:predicted ATP-dependent endonuclease of OLD family
MLSVIVADVDTDPPRTYEIDSLSSGEKGLALTFLLVAMSMEKGGIVLLDEPELHLNPAVCKYILSFLTDYYSVRRELQFIVCTHSPEILHGAFSSENCSLYHVVSERNVTRVGSAAIDE